MKYLFKTVAQNLLSVGDAFATKLTGKGEFLAFVEKLHPVSTGGELIRLGPSGDGGYLVPNDLEHIAACFSPGVSDVSGFEMDCAEQGMKVFMADRSVEQPAEFHERFHFTRKYIGVTSNEDFMTLDDWVYSCLPDSTEDLLLQMDIEGFEYETILGCSDALMRRFRIVVAEFHRLDLLWSEPFFQLASRSFEKILQTHRCVHIHPNNICGSTRRRGLEMPVGAEFTFLRNDRIEGTRYATKFPHPLDADNDAGLPPLTLPAWWYGKPSRG